jgi:uncharacterized repeat protein (TIGR01451 family)
VAAFATAAPDEAAPTANIVIDSARTIDATPPFDATVQQLADVSVTIADSPDPAKRNRPLTYTVPVKNLGPGDAKGVSLSDTIPTHVTFKSVRTTQGTCKSPTAQNHALSCSLGDLASGSTATVTITVLPLVKGTLSNTVTVTSASPGDPDSSNNSATAQTTVNG